MSINWKSPIWFVPMAIVAVFAVIEGIHISMHSEYCKTESQWINQQEGLTYDRESKVK